MGMFGKFFTVFLATTTEIRSPKDLSAKFRSMYTDLERPGQINQYATASKTLRFSYVTPPITSENGTVITSTWNNATIQSSSSLPIELEPDPTKPVAVYLPGLDGYGISASTNQFNDLADKFQFWRLTVLPEDRSSFGDMVFHISDFIEELSRNTSKPVTIIGESCGGLIASAVALKLQKRTVNTNSNNINDENSNNIIQGLVLVNPATSFDETSWDTAVPLLTSLQYLDTPESRQDGLTPYSVLGSLILSSIVPDNDQFRRLVDTILNLPELTFPVTDPKQLQSVWDATTDSFRETEERLPPELLEHRIFQWLVSGTHAVNQRLGQLKDMPTLIVVGEEDKLLPSKQEADRLKKVLTNAEVLRVRDRGHFVLDENVNLTEAIIYSKIDPYDTHNKKKYDPVLDWKIPSTVHDYIKRTVQPARDTFSPIYVSTDMNGKRWMGLGKVPCPKKNGPLLFVANHQFAALDLSILVADLYEERDIFMRGLAHPVTFAAGRSINFELDGRTPGLLQEDDPIPFIGGFEKYGAVKVTPLNYYRLLQTGQNVLLFPGGAAEALTGNKSYPLFWPDKVDFVRTAARFNATIVPLSAIGMVDSVNVIAEPQEVYKIPFLGERARLQNANVTAARYDRKNEDEVIGFPVFLPALPARNYFLYGKPIDTTNIDPNDKEACAQIYYQARAEVRRGLDDLIRVREHDPFKSAPRRLAYERFFGKKAPTFSISELNK